MRIVRANRPELAVSDDSLLHAATRVFGSSEDTRQLAALLRLRLVMSAFKMASSGDTSPSTDDCVNALRDATMYPRYPFMLPEIREGQSLTTVVRLNDDTIGTVGPIELSFTAQELFDAFRKGDCKSLARSSYSFFMRELLSDVLVFGEREPTLLHQNEESFRKLVGLCIYADDLPLAVRGGNPSRRLQAFARFSISDSAGGSIGIESKRPTANSARRSLISVFTAFVGLYSNFSGKPSLREDAVQITSSVDE